MTYARRVPLHLLRRYRWYNPRLKSDAASDRGDGGGEAAANYIEMGEIAVHAANEGDGGDVLDDDGSAPSFASFNRAMLRRPSRRVERPSLEKAWAFFEHVTLPRYLDHSPSTLARANAAGTRTTTTTTTTAALDESVPAAKYEDGLEGRNVLSTTVFVGSMPPPLAKKKTNVAPAAPFGEWVLCHIRGSD
mmetsp:Transcript_58542/g.124202  ORF Transcript_58542/g.124202 Transcript_58542/m.124202 type:complete len:191 (-) Transcript_58542:156-728(-)